MNNENKRKWFGPNKREVELELVKNGRGDQVASNHKLELWLKFAFRTVTFIASLIVAWFNTPLGGFVLRLLNGW